MLRVNALIAFAVLSSVAVQPPTASVLDTGSSRWVGSYDSFTPPDVPPWDPPQAETVSVGCPAVVVETFGGLAEQACQISYCESRWNPGALGDINSAGEPQSWGMFQLWGGWSRFAGVTVESLLDPAVNAAVALQVREHRGRWGGAGGWSCADHLGIP
jgi:hypothetical protein